MKLFLDTAEINEIQQAAATGVLDGVTTNPSLVAKSGRKFEEVIAEICAIVDGQISAEVVSTTPKEMLQEAYHLAAIHPNVVIKLPMIRAAMPIVQQLTSENIKTNVTLVFSVNQALVAAKAGATYVSPFVGRLDDIGENGMVLVKNILEVFRNYNFSTQVLAASIRHLEHVMEAATIGAHVATMPYKVFEQLFNHPLTDKGLEKFLQDWNHSSKNVR